ncbi:hypothetical protein HOF56_02180 [Candidatus Peribacteria bacterium]|nr:hypothetical protein [Candidatus Peribacteria bacterium]MBT4021657.1 hypothetical protein [Candidatus Peribacteria bacterium]MBT4240821.1 hypothetical protein [Candidatus Peribacteria bacterium]MBT4474150.1 hypothetical protein [Candidatus Peribacteria bacterium]
MFSAMKKQLSETTSELLSQTSDKIVEVVPQIILALLVLIVSIIVARIACKLVKHIFDVLGLDKIANKVNVDRMLRMVGIKRSVSSIFCFLIYWLIILAALLLITDILQLGAVSDAIGAIVSYIPHLIVGLFILVIGLILGRFLRDVVSTFCAKAGISYAELLGAVVQVVIVIFVCLIALQQIGFDVSVITMNAARILAILFIAISFAGALAAKPFLENAITCMQLKSHLKIGDHIDCECDIKGEIVKFLITGVVIKSGDSTVVIPAKKLFENKFKISK